MPVMRTRSLRSASGSAMALGVGVEVLGCSGSTPARLTTSMRRAPPCVLQCATASLPQGRARGPALWREGPADMVSLIRGSPDELIIVR